MASETPDVLDAMLKLYNLKMSLPTSRIRFIVGIDEAGRGPLAGPVSVGAVVVSVTAIAAKKLKLFSSQNSSYSSSLPLLSLSKLFSSAKFHHSLFQGVKDSKMLTSASRDRWFKKIKTARKEGKLDYRVSCVGSKIIDRKGIVFAIRLAVKRSLEKLGVSPHQTLVLLDGSLSAPKHFLFQKTIIRGDQTVPIISLASIAAKVVRDKKMIRLSKKFPDFGFNAHKGYGTLSHRRKIRKYGPCEIHRRSFLRGILR